MGVSPLLWFLTILLINQSSTSIQPSYVQHLLENSWLLEDPPALAFTLMCGTYLSSPVMILGWNLHWNDK